MSSSSQLGFSQQSNRGDKNGPKALQSLMVLGIRRGSRDRACSVMLPPKENYRPQAGTVSADCGVQGQAKQMTMIYFTGGDTVLEDKGRRVAGRECGFKKKLI